MSPQSPDTPDRANARPLTTPLLALAVAVSIGAAVGPAMLGANHLGPRSTGDGSTQATLLARLSEAARSLLGRTEQRPQRTAPAARLALHETTPRPAATGETASAGERAGVRVALMNLPPPLCA